MTVLSCLVAKESRGDHRRKDLADVYRKVVEIAIIQIIGNVEEFVKHWGWNKVGIKADMLGSS